MFASVLAAAVFVDARRFDWTGDSFTNRPGKWAAGVIIPWVIVHPMDLWHERNRPRAAN